MLTQLVIENIALIERLDLRLQPGLTVITGETGAGKSILVDALGLILGSRADPSLIRSGTTKAMVQARFELAPDHPGQQWLEEQALDTPPEADDGPHEVFVRRVITTTGRNRAFINETSVPTGSLQKFGELLVDLHGQHDHQSLLHARMHLAILDGCAGPDHPVRPVELAWQRWHDCYSRLVTLRDRVGTVEERRSFLLFQLNEMIHVQLQDGELETLRARKARLTHGTRLAELVDQTLGHLRDHEEAALQRLQSGAGTLATGVRFDASLEEMVAAIQSLQYELESVIERIGQYRQGLEIDPAELEQVDERLDHINRLCRKHRCEADELVRLVGKWQQELADLDHIEEQEKTLERELLLLQQRYDQEAARLSQARAAIAIQLTEQVTRQLQDLYMPHTRFAVQQTLHGKGPRQTGDDQIEFLISTNPGEPVKPLRQVASGGELARIMLALKSVLANAVAIGTLIFDEVDTGISGRVAASVGDKLQQIARQNRQVIAITHLPQVAAWGDHHVKVAKEVWTSDDAMATTGASMTSRVTVHGLTPPERVEELARLLAGEQVTEPARINARELLEHARQPRE